MGSTIYPLSKTQDFQLFSPLISSHLCCSVFCLCLLAIGCSFSVRGPPISICFRIGSYLPLTRNRPETRPVLNQPLTETVVIPAASQSSSSSCLKSVNQLSNCTGWGGGEGRTEGGRELSPDCKTVIIFRSL